MYQVVFPHNMDLGSLIDKYESRLTESIWAGVNFVLADPPATSIVAVPMRTWSTPSSRGRT